MSMGERTSGQRGEKTEIERAIEELFAAGLELQAGACRSDASPDMAAVLPGYVRRIGDLMTDLRRVAERS
ncbi:MAG TPA: hypothetical protein VIK11_06150 [Tepidiformaceae bacterium]|jgi:hypothetical protein